MEEGEGVAVRRWLAVGAALAVVAGAGAAPGSAVPGSDAHPAGAATKPRGVVATEATRTFRFTYSVVVRDIPRGARTLSIWIPAPKTDRHQEVLDLVVKAPIGHSFTHEKRYGNRLVHLSAAAPLPDSIELELDALVARRAYRVLGAKSRPGERDRPAPQDLRPDALVPIDGVIAAEALKVTAGARTPLEKARAIYDHVATTMRYDKSGEGWGRGDAIRACDVRTGNCTDFHSLIIGMARSCGIPARFVMGFPLPEDRSEGAIPGYHCWAEVYVEGVGWLPLDGSEASKHPEKREALFGGLDANRVEFTRGRDIELVPKASSRLNFLVYPRVEVDGVEHSAVKQSFSFAEVKS